MLTSFRSWTSAHTKNCSTVRESKKLLNCAREQNRLKSAHLRPVVNHMYTWGSENSGRGSIVWYSKRTLKPVPTVLDLKPVPTAVFGDLSHAQIEYAKGMSSKISSRKSHVFCQNRCHVPEIGSISICFSDPETWECMVS